MNIEVAVLLFFKIEIKIWTTGENTSEFPVRCL
jgi:hypothetical protein